MGESENALDELRTELAVGVRAYLAMTDHGSPAGHERLQRICAQLEWFLNGLLRDHPGWTRHRYVDGLLPESVVVTSPLGLEIRAMMIWGKGRSQWVEPFLGALGVSPTVDRIESYEFRFGDAGQGLGKVPFRPRRHRPADPARWLFTLADEAGAGGQ
ncbi:hypothetical protein [Micromonospora sp. NBC_01796]|uniref:hypothetical protein n=1 Tax=Micromonospora sp. NBC_01796 TaxID=2975987 RepID=UPI002DDA6702|nr:hypothetical protein [Micromonospora sp. NBC_01796]WSA85415.1 hypothetical protein OIE47_34530 [Micromonospora sp. NBC_01796]